MFMFASSFKMHFDVRKFVNISWNLHFPEKSQITLQGNYGDVLGTKKGKSFAIRFFLFLFFLSSTRKTLFMGVYIQLFQLRLSDTTQAYATTPKGSVGSCKSDLV